MVTYRQLFSLGEFRALFVTTAAGVAGATMRMLALSALVYAQTNSALLAALAYLGGFLPQAFGALTLLSLADRLPPRAALVGWGLVHTGVVALLATGVLPVWGMLALLMVAGLGDAVSGAIRNTVVVDVVPSGAYVLGRSVLNIAVGAMQIIGFAVGGTLLALTGPTGALWVAAALALVATAVTRFGLLRRAPRATGRASVALTWRGNRVLFGDATIRRLLLAQWIPNGLIVGAEAMFVPYASNAAGAMFAGAAFGMLVGDLVIGRWTSPGLRSRLALPLYLLLGAPYLAFMTNPGAAVATVLVSLASFGFAGTLTLQERFVTEVPDRLLGQAMGLASSGMMTAQAVGAAAVGGVAEALSPGPAMAIAAVASLVVSVLLLAPRLGPARVRPVTALEQPATALDEECAVAGPSPGPMP